MSLHPFNFDGGSELSDMGATWFVSYKYYKTCDISHLNWKLIDSYNRRINIYENTNQYHKYWLEKILRMNNKKLNTNEIRIDARETKKMANCVLAKLNSEIIEKRPKAILIKKKDNNIRPHFA